jgi:hypothetical protein
VYHPITSQNNRWSRRHLDHLLKHWILTPLASTCYYPAIHNCTPLFPTHSSLSLLFSIQSFIHSLTYSVSTRFLTNYPCSLYILILFPSFFFFLFFSFLSHMSHDGSSMKCYNSRADLSLLRLLTPIITHPDSYSRIPLYINVCS